MLAVRITRNECRSGQLSPPRYHDQIVAKLLPAAAADGEAEPRGPQRCSQVELMPSEAQAADGRRSLSDIRLNPERPIWLRVLVEMPLAALAEPATQTNAATSVERITLFILGVVSRKRGDRGGVERTQTKSS